MNYLVPINLVHLEHLCLASLQLSKTHGKNANKAVINPANKIIITI